MVMSSCEGQVLLVTGGWNSNAVRLDFTELLVPGFGFWRLTTGLLPRPMAGVRGATVDNILYVTGNIHCHYIVIMGPVLMFVSRWQ